MPTMLPAMPRVRTGRLAGAGLAALLSLGALTACGGPPKPEGPTPRGVALPVQPPALQHELRGVWIATVNNIDWPSKRGLSTDSMKAELLALIDRAAQLHFNAIIFQVRPAGDALYKSSIEPWSPFVTGTMGKAPDGDFDPLAFVVKESHARGMQVHAWFNPYRAGFVNDRWKPSPDHVSNKHPGWVRRYGGFYWMDPGIPAVREYSLSVFRDVVRRYDVDGIHIDDYFYPYVEKDSATRQDIPFPDADSYKAYQLAGGKLTLSDWRRENVNKLVQGMAEVAHAVKPWVLVGVSPIGVYRPGIPSGGFDSYESIYCDSKRWLNEGWVDYYVPQIYWTTASSNPYGPVLKWWAGENTQNRHLWAGNFTTRTGGRDPQWTVDELVQQIKLTRAQKGAGGNVHFSAKFLYGTTPISEALRKGVYADPAIVPSSPWLGTQKPAAPLLTLGGSAAAPVVRFAPGNKVPVRFWAVRYFDGTQWQTQIVGHETTSLTLPAGLERPFYVAVSAIGPTGIEGPLGTAKSAK